MGIVFISIYFAYLLSLLLIWIWTNKREKDEKRSFAREMGELLSDLKNVRKSIDKICEQYDLSVDDRVTR